jgi:transposase-like protein
MNLVQLYINFPNRQDCINHLEKVRWNNKPTCPYCKSTNQTPMPKENRYHCNTCNTSFSVMVGTVFENTKLDFQKWFLAISLVLNAKNRISARRLAYEIGVTKNTAWLMLMRIRTAMLEYSELLEGIIVWDEKY